MSIEIKISESNKAPPIIIGDGKLTPRNIAQWERYANAYFLKAKTPEGEKVSSVLNCFSGLHLLNWIDMNRDKFLADGYTFETFMKSMRACFLDPNWEEIVICEEVSRNMTDDQSFAMWSAGIISGNTLVGPDHRLSVPDLRKHLRMSLSKRLTTKLSSLKKADKDALEAIEDFDEWRREIIMIDEAHRKDLEAAKEFMFQSLGKRPHPDAEHTYSRLPPAHRDPEPAYSHPPRVLHNSRNYNTPASGANAVGYHSDQRGSSSSSSAFLTEVLEEDVATTNILAAFLPSSNTASSFALGNGYDTSQENASGDSLVLDSLSKLLRNLSLPASP
ncbi:hypothetical protein CVT26_002276 [Gymnopilus dilepis]|uniref:Uncharacterized protein n=1 Tax=Gymnopilus dilepis TaxID=231916 RepID=A0A409YN37_9AGAR|nr:hypothetical protein CVT26_002276 [Gymnopilus dilepis]